MNTLEEGRCLGEQYMRYLRERCTGPGKFEGEPPLTVYLYELLMDGDGEAQEDESVRFELSSEERQFFDIGASEAYLFEDEQGFVTSWLAPVASNG
jgi:hypothetical protein